MEIPEGSLPPILPPLDPAIYPIPPYPLGINDTSFLLHQLFLQMELQYQQIVEICRNDGKSMIWHQAQSFFQAKLDEINRYIALLSSDSNEFLEDSSPRTTARKVEQIKKTFKLRADAPPFIPTNLSSSLSNVGSPSPPPAPGLHRPSKTLTSYSKITGQSPANNSIHLTPNSASKVPLLLWSNQKPKTDNDDWDEDSIRDEVTKASEQIWQEAEAWIEAAMAAEDEEWKFLELGINQMVGLPDGRYTTQKQASLSVTNPDEIPLDGLLIETSFDAAAEVLLAHSPVESGKTLKTPGKSEADDGSPIQSSKYSSPPTRSLHQKLSSPDRRRALSPTALKRRYEAKLQAAENNRDKSVAEKVQKAMIASNRVKEISLREAKRQAEAGEALQEKLQNAELRHSERLNQIKEKAVSENAKVLGVSLVNSQNSEALARHVQQKLEEVEAKILAANQRREQRLEEISGSQRKKNTRRAQQMSEFRLLLEKEKMERWEKLQKRFEAVQERRKKRLEELKRRAEAVESNGGHGSVPSLARLTLVDDVKLAKTIETYSPKLTFGSSEPIADDNSAKHTIEPSSPITSTVKNNQGEEEQEKRRKPSIVNTENNMNTLHPHPTDSLSFDGLDITPSGQHHRRHSFKVLDMKINMSNSEEIELVLFPAVAKAHAKFLELMKRQKIINFRSQTILACFACIDCNPNNAYYQNILALLRPEDSALLRSPSKMIGSEEVTPSTSSKDKRTGFDPEKERDSQSGAIAQEDLSPFHQFIESIEETRKFMNIEERGASSYNIYASIIKELRIYGLNCNMDLIEKINFLITKMMDTPTSHHSQHYHHPNNNEQTATSTITTSATSSLEIDDFLRSGGMLLFPVLLSYEYGVLSDLSNIQNFINSIIIFTRNSLLHHHHGGSNSEQGSPSHPITQNKDPGLSPDIMHIKKYKKAMIQQFVQQTFAMKTTPDASISTVASTGEPNMVTPMFQQIDFYNVIDLFAWIIRDYSMDLSLLLSMSVPMALFDLCIYFHYLFIQVNQDRLHSPESSTSTGAPDSLFVPDVVYSYSMSVVRTHCGKILSLLAKILSEAVLFIITEEQKEILPDKENVPSATNSRDKEENTENQQRMEDQKAIIGTAIFQFQQLSFQCQLLTLISEQVQMELSLVQSSFQKLQVAMKSSSSATTWIHISSTYYDELPSHINYFLSVIEYIRSISLYLQLSHDYKEIFTSPVTAEKERASTTSNNSSAKTLSITPQQVTTMTKHWLSQIRKYRVIDILVKLFSFASDGIFALLEEVTHISSIVPEKKTPQRTPLATKNTPVTKTASLATSEFEKYDNISSLFQLLQTCVDTFHHLLSMEPDLLMQLSSTDKIFLIERFVDWFIFLVFLLDKSKDLSEVLTLQSTSISDTTTGFSSSSIADWRETITYISKLCKQSYPLLENLFRSLSLLVHRLILSDMEIRKIIGESSEKRQTQYSTSSSGSSSSKIIQFILLHGANDRMVSSTSTTASVASSTSESMEIELNKTSLLRQKLCLLQIICLLSTKYYKDTRFKPILLSLLILASLEMEYNTQMIIQYKKDKWIWKYLQYFLSLSSRKIAHDLEEKEEEKQNKKKMVREEGEGEDQVGMKGKEGIREKLNYFYELLPESVMERVKIIWLQK